METKIRTKEICLGVNEEGCIEYLLSFIMRGREVGCVGVIFNKERSFFIFDLCVDRYFQKKGVATKLLLECERLAKELNADSMYLDVYKKSWREDWFKRLGFLGISDCPHEEHFVRMSKKVK